MLLKELLFDSLESFESMHIDYGEYTKVLTNELFAMLADCEVVNYYLDIKDNKPCMVIKVDFWEKVTIMAKHKFSKDGISKMYQEVVAECYKALDDGTIDGMDIEVKMGSQVINIPMNADFMEIVFAALNKCEKEK